MFRMKVLTAAFLCLSGAGTAFCQNEAGPNAPPNVYNDYKYEFFKLPHGASGNLTAINDLDIVAGTYYPTDPCCAPGSSGMAYIRYPNGKITVFTIANATGVSMTVRGLNDHGELIGSYTDKTTGYDVGYIRYADGKIKTLALGGATDSTIPTGINNEGQVFGVIANFNQGSLDVAFLRYPDGQYLTYGIPGSTSLFTNNINDRGVGLGSYFCSNSLGGVCGFYGKPGGNVTTFDYPPNGMIPAQINRKGIISGEAFLAPFGEDYFLRYPDGKFVLFGLSKLTGLEIDSSIDSLINGLNDHDEAIGQYTVYYPNFDPPTNINGSYTYDFIRTPDGKIRYYDPPKAPGTLLGNVINNRGVIAGQTVSEAAIGLFLLVPKHCRSVYE